MRRRLLGVVAAACLTAPALALAADTDPQKRLTPADQAKARTFLLRQADLGARWKRSPAVRDAGEEDEFQCAGYNPDESDLTLTGEAEVEFTNAGGGVLASFANIYRTAAEARTSWRRGNRPAFARCMAEVLKTSFAREKVTAEVTSYGRIPVARVAERVAAFRVRFTVASPELPKPISFTVHLVALGNGRGDAGLLAMAPLTGFRTADLTALAKLLSRRMVAAQL